MKISTLYATAELLKSEDGANPEYDRALIEFISYVTGEDTDLVAARLKINDNP